MGGNLGERSRVGERICVRGILAGGKGRAKQPRAKMRGKRR